jgi:hypothetical protein
MQISPSPVVTPPLIALPGCRDPNTGTRDWTIHVRTSMLEDLEQHGPEWKFYNAQLIPEALEAPTVILQGLNRVGFDDAYCYSRVPSCRWIDESTKGQPLPYAVFVVFVACANPAVVLDWEWRMADQSHPGYPRKWQTDFGNQVWP